MRKPIRISIPSPCHEDWEKMTPVDKGRFCGSCQKNVIDFSRLSDREIVSAYKKGEDLCGLFLDTQLDRDLILPAERSRWWVTASAAVLSVMGGIPEAGAQTTTSVEQHRGKVTQDSIHKRPEIIATGQVLDASGPLPGATVLNTSSKNSALVDVDGNFSLAAKAGDTLEILYQGFDTQKIIIQNDVPVKVHLVEAINPQPVVLDVYRRTSPEKIAGGYTVISREMIVDRTEKKRTFFGRIFHRIGNLFR